MRILLAISILCSAQDDKIQELRARPLPLRAFHGARLRKRHHASW